MPNELTANALDDVINKSLADATAEDTPSETPQDPPEDEETDEVDEDTPEADESAQEGAEDVSEASDDDEEPESEESDDVSAESADTEKVAAKAKDDFEEQHGIKAKTKAGKENRIPYSRVKKIVANAETAALKKVETELTSYKEKAEQFTQLETFVTTRPDDFIQVLSTMPAYKPFFDNLKQVLDSVEGGEAVKKPEAVPEEPVADDMPAPNVVAEDGSKSYDEAGLRKLLDWNAKQVEERVTAQLTQKIGDRYKPIEEEWQRHARIQQVMPEVQRKAAEARQWPLFTENEAEIVKVLQENQGIGLEAAYRQVVIPKIQEGATVTKEQMRQKLLKELKRSPKSTSAPSSGTRQHKEAPVPGSRDLTEVIVEAIEKSGVRP